jgi:hypothetical protein
MKVTSDLHGLEQVVRIPALLGLFTSLALSFHIVADESHPFGNEQAGESALMGIFYDLTQDQDGNPTGINMRNYGVVLIDFIKHGWNENEMSGFYRASRPLFTTQIWIPTLPTLAGPKAFGVEKRAPHALWVIHYKGQITPPEDGTYRFVGFGDDVLAVAINQKLVLVSDFTHMNFGIPEGTPAGGPLKAGLWIDCKKAEPMDIDILCCDNGDPRGLCASFILVEEKGKTYEMDNGYPVLPIFQVAPYDTPQLPPGKHNHFKFSPLPSLWKALQ